MSLSKNNQGNYRPIFSNTGRTPSRRKKAPQGMHTLRATTLAPPTATPKNLPREEGNSNIFLQCITPIIGLHLLFIGGLLINKLYFSNEQSADRGQLDHTLLMAPIDTTNEIEKNPDYLVKQGESYSSIAKSQYVEEHALRTLNNNRNLHPGLVITLPTKNNEVVSREVEDTMMAQTPINSLPKASQPVSSLSTHAAGESKGHTIDTSNAPKAIVVSEESTSPQKPVLIQAATQLAQKKAQRHHLVRKGETLYKISRHYKVDVKELQRLNKITNVNLIRVGQELRIP